MIKLPLDKIDDIFTAIAESKKLYLPVDKDDGDAEYTEWTAGKKWSNAVNTVRSAKDFFFAKTESLYDIKMHDKKIDIVDTRSELDDFVLFGVRACDAASFAIIDRVYLRQDPVDTYYKNRREHGIIITTACTKTMPTCFCKLFDIDAANPGGDISSWKDETSIWFEPLTDKGRALLDSLKTAFEKAGAEADASTEPVDDLKNKITAVMSKQPFADEKMEKFKGENLLELFNSKKWGELSESCLGCGTCTYVCPTCMCYNIRDFKVGDETKRYRTWDSCMYSDFTKMAAANPRTTQLERFRQRFMHKLVYYPAKYENVYACVGCGRCLQKCPVSMNIVKVMRSLNEDTTAPKGGAEK
ncbi:MAG: 4Fe-4S dicluster domain-containing protein [Treponema sp.]|jgi:ferredoxin|nr:4Fe-4S dicluster domain-containing protein [Treponema sp.]